MKVFKLFFYLSFIYILSSCNKNNFSGYLGVESVGNKHLCKAIAKGDNYHYLNYIEYKSKSFSLELIINKIYDKDFSYRIEYADDAFDDFGNANINSFTISFFKNKISYKGVELDSFRGDKIKIFIKNIEPLKFDVK